jgi:hypothetical protein
LLDLATSQFEDFDLAHAPAIMLHHAYADDAISEVVEQLLRAL